MWSSHCDRGRPRVDSSAERHSSANNSQRPIYRRQRCKRDGKQSTGRRPIREPSDSRCLGQCPCKALWSNQHAQSSCALCRSAEHTRKLYFDCRGARHDQKDCRCGEHWYRCSGCNLAFCGAHIYADRHTSVEGSHECDGCSGEPRPQNAELWARFAMGVPARPATQQEEAQSTTLVLGQAVLTHVQCGRKQRRSLCRFNAMQFDAASDAAARASIELRQKYRLGFCVFRARLREAERRCSRRLSLQDAVCWFKVENMQRPGSVARSGMLWYRASASNAGLAPPGINAADVSLDVWHRAFGHLGSRLSPLAPSPDHPETRWAFAVKRKLALWLVATLRPLPNSSRASNLRLRLRLAMRQRRNCVRPVPHGSLSMRPQVLATFRLA